MVQTQEIMGSIVVKKMQELGTYKPQFDHLISIYAGMLFQYQEFEGQFIKSGYEITEEYTNKAGATNQRKTPIYSAMESLRKDIASYSDRLLLNPKAVDSINFEFEKKTKLSQLLGSLED